MFVSQDQVWEAWSQVNDREDWQRILLAWARTYNYYWSNDHMHFPLGAQESNSRRAITDEGYRFMAAHYNYTPYRGVIRQGDSQ